VTGQPSRASPVSATNTASYTSDSSAAVSFLIHYLINSVVYTTVAYLGLVKELRSGGVEDVGVKYKLT